MKAPALLLCLVTLLCAPVASLAQSAALPTDRVVRVTTGYHQVSGWEKPLVDGNPNLGHYHWTPMNGMDQGYLRIRTPQRPQGPLYTKPIHVSPDAYVPKVRESQPLANRVDPPALRRENSLAGQILPEKKVAAMVAQPPKVAVYGNYSTYDTRGTLLKKPAQQDFFSSNEKVSGVLLTRAKKSKLGQSGQSI